MIKTKFIIDCEPYNALFLDYAEMCDFIADTAIDGGAIQVEYYEYVMPLDILHSDEFEYSYRIEMFCTALYPELARQCDKWAQQEQILIEKGWL